MKVHLKVQHNKRPWHVRKQVRLPLGFAVAVDRMVNGYVPWYQLDRWVKFMRYGGPRGRAWQIRVLWFYFGRVRANRK